MTHLVYFFKLVCWFRGCCIIIVVVVDGVHIFVYIKKLNDSFSLLFLNKDQSRPHLFVH